MGTYPSIEVRFKDIVGEENFYSVGQFFYQKGTYIDAVGAKKLRVNWMTKKVDWTTKYEYIADKGRENQIIVAQPFDLRVFFLPLPLLPRLLSFSSLFFHSY